ncbi:MAG: hypothetical protein ABIH09_03985 [Candidatus Omnitrophota bacterium]
MRKTLFLLIMSVILVTVVFSPFAVSQEQEDLENYTDGTVVNVSDGIITISEYDFDVDGEKNVVYEITSESEFENVDSLGNIQKGNEVSIEYIVKDGKNQIVSIYLYEEEE